MKREAPTNLPADILWGADEIGAYIKRSRQATYYLIRKGAIPAKKIGPKTLIGRKSEDRPGHSTLWRRASDAPQ